jgi:hypothetical protein
MVLHESKVIEAARGKIVDNDDGLAVRQQALDKVRTDESGSAGYDDMPHGSHSVSPGTVG